MMPDLTTTQDLHGHDFASATFNALSFRDGLRHVHRASFAASDLTLARMSVFGTVELSEQSTHEVAVVLRPDPDTLIYLRRRRGHGEISVAGLDRDAVDRVAADMIASLGDAEPPEDEVPLVFWRCASGRPSTSRRRIHASSWEDVRGNYSAGVQDELEELMAARGCGPGGLILWHGEPGTGKSHALRALARQWQPWCDAHVITDADVFLGGNSSYLMDALVRDRDERWRLIALEDAGELLTADARALAGQGLSQLLNLTDGLLGAGMRASVLVTTNEPLGRLHPAVVRPGRAWAEVEFRALSGEEANAWLVERECDVRVERATTIAELYEIEAGRAPTARSLTVGFAA